MLRISNVTSGPKTLRAMTACGEEGAGGGAGGVVYMRRGIGDNGDDEGDHIWCRLRPRARGG